jgi:hypothetical protein
MGFVCAKHERFVQDGERCTWCEPELEQREQLQELDQVDEPRPVELANACDWICRMFPCQGAGCHESLLQGLR